MELLEGIIGKILSIMGSSLIKCHFCTLQNMMAHTFRGCTHHTLCFIYYAFYWPEIYHINYVLQVLILIVHSKIKHLIAIVSGVLQIYPCHSCALSNLTTHAFMRDYIHHTSCFTSVYILLYSHL